MCNCFFFFTWNPFSIYILFTYYTITNSRHSGVDTHQRQERREGGSEKMEEKRIEAQRTRPHPNPGNWCAHRRGRGEEKIQDRTKKETGSGLPPSFPRPFGRLLRPAGIIRWPYSCNPGPQGDFNYINYMIYFIWWFLFLGFVLIKLIIYIIYYVFVRFSF